MSNINKELHDFDPLINSACSNATSLLLCSVHAPYCNMVSDSNKQLPQPVYPCKKLCQYVENGLLLRRWLASLDCDNAELFKSGPDTFCPDFLMNWQNPNDTQNSTK